MYAGRYFNESVSVLIVDDQELVREALASFCGRIRGLVVAGLARGPSEVLAQATRCRPDLILWGVSLDAGFFDSVAAVKHHCAPARIVLLDERMVDANARQALRLEVAGYLTKHQPLAQFERALREAHEGELVFVPDVAARLQFTSDGMRLAASSEATPLAAANGPRDGRARADFAGPHGQGMRASFRYQRKHGRQSQSPTDAQARHSQGGRFDAISAGPRAAPRGVTW